LPGHTRTARWIDSNHLLVISDVKKPREKAPYTYDKNAVYVIKFEDGEPKIRTLARHDSIRNAIVASDARHVIVTTRDWTSCWNIGETEPVWIKPKEYVASPGDGTWVLLHGEENAVICSLTTGKELRRWQDIVASRRDGSTVWLCSASGIEVWKAENK
jgi:hypothetical protein